MSKQKTADRVRFNWGYHDAAFTVKHNLDSNEQNYGFGMALNITCPRDVVEQHFDHAYAIGWQAGYADAKDGMYQGNSEQAWMRDRRLV